MTLPTAQTLHAWLFPEGDARLMGASLGMDFEAISARVGGDGHYHWYGEEDERPYHNIAMYDDEEGGLTELTVYLFGRKPDRAAIDQLSALIEAQLTPRLGAGKDVAEGTKEWQLDHQGRKQALSVSVYEDGGPCISLGVARSHKYVQPGESLNIADVMAHLSKEEPGLVKRLFKRR
jgi:hypothetical protein